jgi:hypothetical protein
VKNLSVLIKGFLVAAAALLASPFIHELGHVTAALALGAKVEEVQLLPIITSAGIFEYTRIDFAGLSVSAIAIILLSGFAVSSTGGIVLLIRMRRSVYWPLILFMPITAIIGSGNDFSKVDALLSLRLGAGLITFGLGVVEVCFLMFFMLVWGFGLFGFKPMGKNKHEEAHTRDKRQVG